jgi:hypothetical protein
MIQEKKMCFSLCSVKENVGTMPKLAIKQSNVSQNTENMRKRMLLAGIVKCLIK